ncbi:nuclease [Geranomyces variabilis]|nr:nuclease [Geranomyces variabilis]
MSTRAYLFGAAGLGIGIGSGILLAQYALPRTVPPPVFSIPDPDLHKQRPVATPEETAVMGPAQAAAAKDIMRYGFPGPVSDRLYRNAYVGSYNRALRNPNWIAEHLTAKSLERAASDALPLALNANVAVEDTPSRKHSTFKEDLAIPRLFRAKLKDYVASGYDRGHLVPAADVRGSQEAMDETFLLTNVSPQVGMGFNRNYWFYFENFVRSLTSDFDDVYVVTGPLYLPAQAADGKFYVKYEVIGDPPNVAVPTHFYKVILGVKNGQTAMQGFVMPNDRIGPVPLESFAMPLDAIERAAGLVFFPDVSRLKYQPLCKVTKCQIRNFFVESSRGLKLAGPR